LRRFNYSRATPKKERASTGNKLAVPKREAGVPTRNLRTGKCFAAHAISRTWCRGGVDVFSHKSLAHKEAQKAQIDFLLVFELCASLWLKPPATSAAGNSQAQVYCA
jgi:hypothetical protein